MPQNWTYIIKAVWCRAYTVGYITEHAQDVGTPGFAEPRSCPPAKDRPLPFRTVHFDIRDRSAHLDRPVLSFEKFGNFEITI